MSEIQLSDGRTLNLDMHRVTIAEWRSLFDQETTIDQEDAIISRAFGLNGYEEVQALSQPDYRLLAKLFFDAGTEPLADPNSQSASTSGSSETAKAGSPGNTGDGSSPENSDGVSNK